MTSTSFEQALQSFPIETRQKILYWMYQDASRLLLSPQEALKEIEKEEFEKKSEEEKKKIISEQLKAINDKEEKIKEIKAEISDILKDKLEKNKIPENEIDFTLKLKDEILHGVYPELVGGVKNDNRKRKKATRLRSRNKNIDQAITSQLQSWQKLYKKEFNIDIDINKIDIPEKQAGFNWLIIVHKYLKLSQIYNKLKSLFNCYKYIKNIDKIERIAKRPPQIQGKPDTDIYAIWVRDRIEADEELKNKSANQIQEENINPVTLEERLLLELFYWRETKKHLDLNNWTLCAGSLDPSGIVPYVAWCREHRRLVVRWYFASDVYPVLQCRQAVSA